MLKFKSKIVSAILLAAMMFNLTAAVRAEDNSIDKMIANMTTKQKITQMLMPSARYYTDENGNRQNMTELNGEIKKLIEKYPFSGVILYAMNITGNEQAVKLTDEFQKANAIHNMGQLLISTDQEGGRVARLTSGTQFPGNMALGASGNTQYAYETGEIMGKEIQALGINTDFAPVVDVNNNPSNPVIGVRSFSDDPQTVAKFGVSFMKGLQSTDTISTLKHFPGHGDTNTDSHTGLPCITKSYDELKNFELIPFKACIDNGVEMIMTAHIQYPNIETQMFKSKKDNTDIALPATLSKTIMTDILRGDMGYDGIIVTDAMEMDAISEHFGNIDAAILAINAGVDIILGFAGIITAEDTEKFEEYLTALTDAADSGKISMDNINASVKRILTLKEKKGLLNAYDSTKLDERIANAKATVGSAANHEKEWEITRKSLTLVKNEDNVLPLNRENEKTVILTAYPEEKISADYAKDLLSGDNEIPAGSEIVTDSFRETVEKDGKKANVLKSADSLKELTQDADNVIMITELGNAAGLNPSNNNNDTAAQGAVMDELIPLLRQNGKKVIQISCNLPYDAARYASDAIILAWSPRGMSENPLYHIDGDLPFYGPAIPAAIYTAFSDITPPTGKLPVNIPEINSEYKFTDTVKYERGFGLSYNNIPQIYCCAYYDSESKLLTVKQIDSSKTTDEAKTDANLSKPENAAFAKIFKWALSAETTMETIRIDY